jgi:sulfur carrier protein ThiS
MKVKVQLEGKASSQSFEGQTIKQLMAHLNLILDEYVPVLNGSVVTELERLKEGDQVKFVRVWSGG